MKDKWEQIRTFDDAYNMLGEEHMYVKSYLRFYDWGVGKEDQTMMAFLKLRVITAALNEGWEPGFTDRENRYYPCFWLYAKDEAEQMDAQEREELGMVPTYGKFGNYAYIALGHADMMTVSSSSHPEVEFLSCLCLKSEELACYCGRQFTGLWRDFLSHCVRGRKICLQKPEEQKMACVNGMKVTDMPSVPETKDDADDSYRKALCKAQAWYNEVNDDMKSILEDVFGSEVTTYKVRTFEDALRCLGEGHILVKAYRKLLECQADNLLSHEIAGIQLRIICTALNDEETPGKGNRWMPMFATVKKLGDTYKDSKYLYDYDTKTYFVYNGYLEVSYKAPMVSDVMLYSLKDKDMADYAGKKFISYWLGYMMGK